MDKKIIKNYIYNILYQIVKLVLPVIIVPYTMGHLGESVLGISDFAGNISSWFILFGTLGVNTYGNREIAKVRDNDELRSKTFYEILAMQMFNMAIMMVLFVLYSSVVVQENKLIFYLYCISIFSSAIDITWFYYGIEDFKMVSIRNIVVKCIGVGMIMLLVKTPEQLPLFVIINACSDLVGQGITYYGLRKHLVKVNWSFFEGYKKHILATFILFVPTIAINVYTLLDQTMLGVLIEDKGEVALYKAAQGFVKMFLYFITSIGAVMMPRIANVYYKNKDSEEVSKYLDSTFHLALFLSIPMTIGMITVAPSFIPWYLPKQLGIIRLIQVSSPIIIFISISNVFGIQYLVPTGHNKEYTYSVIGGAVVNFIVNLLLIPRLMGVGAAIGSVVAEFTVMFIQYLIVRKSLKLNVTSSFIKYAISGIIMGAVVLLLGKVLSPSIITNVIQAGCGVIVYFGILFILKEEMVFTVVNKAKELILHRG